MTPALRRPRIRATLESPTTVSEVEARRSQLLSLVVVMLVLVAAAVVLFSITTNELIGVLDLNVLRASFVALAVVFALYAWIRERDLRRTERALIDSKLRAAGLTNRMSELSALSRAARDASAVLSLDHVLRAILRSAHDLMGATRGWVLLFDEARRHLQVAEVLGTDRGQLGAVVSLEEGAWPWTRGRRRPVITRDGPPPIRSPHVSAVPGAGRASMAIPLVGEGDPVGLLNLVVEDGDRVFTDEDLDAMEVFAGHAAVAIANARAYEKERELRERLAELDAQRRESIAHLTHDLKAPLTSILGYANLLTRLGGTQVEEARSYAETIQRQGTRIVEMVDRLVIATRLEDSRPTLKRERLDLQGIVAEQVEALRGLLGERRVDLRIPVDLPAVWGDRSSVEHCLVNLLDNAVKYSPDGSTILVEVGTRETEIRIAVVDEGEGIPEEKLPSVFDRYQRASEGGGMASVGLGLFIVKSLAIAQGGRAWAENEPGKGARVTFTLPFRRDDR